MNVCPGRHKPAPPLNGAFELLCLELRCPCLTLGLRDQNCMYAYSALEMSSSEIRHALLTYSYVLCHLPESADVWLVSVVEVGQA